MSIEIRFHWEDLGLGLVRSLDDRIKRRQELPVNEADSVLKGSANTRYEYFFNAVSKGQEIWTIWDGEHMAEYGEDPAWIPVFPTRQFCELVSINEKDVSFVPIPIDDFVNEIVPYLSANNIVVLIFPNLNQGDVVELDWENFLVELTGSWEQNHEIEAESSLPFQEFAYEVVQKRTAK